MSISSAAMFEMEKGTSTASLTHLQGSKLPLNLESPLNLLLLLLSERAVTPMMANEKRILMMQTEQAFKLVVGNKISRSKQQSTAFRKEKIYDDTQK